MAKTLIVLLCILAPLTDLKIGDIQPAELLMFGVLPVLAAVIAQSGLSINASAELIYLLKRYFIFLVATLVLSMFAMRLPIYPPFDLPLLKTPPILSIARAFQLIIAVGTMLILSACFVNRPNLIRLFVRVYIYSGLMNAVYAIVSWVGLYSGISLPGAYGIDAPRARAFFVEGGPFGVYLVSVIVVVLFRKLVLRDGANLTMRFHLAILLVALFAAFSGAGIILSTVLLIYFQIVNKKVLRLVTVIAIALPLVFMSGLFGKLSSLASSRTQLVEQGAENSDDGNLVTGRIMASILTPRMVADHPFAGIGLGNYSLQRNNPVYLQGLPIVTDAWDLPGLGFAGYAAELGIPLFLVLVWLIWRSARIVQRRRVTSLVVLVASYQFFAHWLGVQITFVYPWMITALALGYALNQPFEISKRPHKYDRD